MDELSFNYNNNMDWSEFTDDLDRWFSFMKKLSDIGENKIIINDLFLCTFCGLIALTLHFLLTF